MSIFPIHTPDTAPEAARPILEGARRKFGFVPNLLGALAESPAALEASVAVSDILGRSSFDAAEREVVLTTVSATNDCAYCVAAHTAIAELAKVPAEVIAAVSEDRPIDEPRLEALRRFTKIVLDKRGWATEADVQALLAAGFERRHALDVVLAVSFKTLLNYADHIIGTPLDAAFAGTAWQKAS